MKKFTVIWMYHANYGVSVVEAEVAFDAIEKVVGFFSDDFRACGTVLCFEGEPAGVRHPLAPKYRVKGIP